MPVSPTYPGVYIEEIPSGVRTITGVATSITAFVGYTSRGHDNYPVRIFGFPDFERAFGGLALDSELSYAMQQFFANGGSEAYVVRVPKNDAKSAKITLRDRVVGTAGGALEITALSKGEWANQVVIDVDYDGIPATDTKSFNLSITDLVTGGSERYVNVTMDKGKSNFVDKIVNNPDSGSKILRVKADATKGRPSASGTVGGDIDLATIKNDENYSIAITSDLPSSKIAALPIPFIAQNETKPTSLLGVCRLLESKSNLELQKMVPGAAIRCVPSGKGIQVTAMIPGAIDSQITFAAGAPNDADTFLNLSIATATANVSHYVLGKGRTAFAQASAEEGKDGAELPKTSDLIGKESDFTGIYALDKVDLFNLLCIPDATRPQAGNSDLPDASVDPNEVFSKALTFCEKRRAFLLIDPPPQVADVPTAIDWKTSGLTVKGKNGAAYFPRLKLGDPLNNFQLRSFAPCGVVAGLYSRTDSARGVWKAPAGTEARLNDVRSLIYKLTDAENGALNPLGLNCFRVFPIYGSVAWGARTLVGADADGSEWKYIPVRRTALFIEESLYRGTQWVVFEPNDEPLWAQIRLNIGAFMNNLFRQGAFQGTTPRQAYFVKCDKETTTQNDINLGIVNIVVGFAPLKPAEFVIIKLQQMAGQIEV